MAFQHEKSHLDTESPLFAARPHIWLQWKGTDVCCDIHCSCGHHSHYDGDFMYFLRCPACKKFWEVGTHVALYEVAEDDPRIKHIRAHAKVPED